MNFLIGLAWVLVGLTYENALVGLVITPAWAVWIFTERESMTYKDPTFEAVAAAEARRLRLAKRRADPAYQRMRRRRIKRALQRQMNKGVYK